MRTSNFTSHTHIHIYMHFPADGRARVRAVSPHIYIHTYTHTYILLQMVEREYELYHLSDSEYNSYDNIGPYRYTFFMCMPVCGILIRYTFFMCICLYVECICHLNSPYGHTCTHTSVHTGKQFLF